MLSDFVVIDDSQADRILVTRSLRKRKLEGLKIREGRDAQDALRLISERCPECLITDVHLPGTSGIGLLAKLQERFGGMPCPVVVITGSGSENTAIEVLEAGAHDYVNKARISEPILWEAVRYALTRFNLRKELEELNQELQRKDRLKTEFVANATHELRTPLSAIVGLISLLQDEPLNDRSQNLVATMSACCDSLLLSVDDILDLTKIEAGEFVLYPSVFHPAEDLDFVASSLRPIAQDKGLNLRLDLPESTPTVYGDARRTRQLLYNLTSNALKFTREGAITLRLRISEENGPNIKLRFEIEDTGIGISSEDQARIFRRHFQAGQSDLRTKGTGLGLAIVESLTRRMGGEVGLRSVEGVGSVFWFELPYQISNHASSSDTTPTNRSTSDWEPSLRVLVAEDNQIIARVIERQLNGLGHRPVVTYDGEEALAAAEEEKFDLVLLDARMPILDGLSAARKLRERFTSEELPIILLTAEAQLERKVWQEAGVDECLVKPVSPDILRSLFRRFSGGSVGKRRQEDIKA